MNSILSPSVFLKYSVLMSLALTTSAWASLSGHPHSDDSISVVESGAVAPGPSRVHADYQVQWNRIFQLADNPTAQNKKAVLKALQSSDWYMKDAGLRAVPRFSVAESRTWARKLLDDSSLVVRTTAVQVLAEVQTEADRSLFWKKLTSKENFHSGQSLWIRRHLVQALAMKPDPTEKPRFEALLKDPDTRLYPAAHQALDRISIRDLCASRSGLSGSPAECDIK